VGQQSVGPAADSNHGISPRENDHSPLLICNKSIAVSVGSARLRNVMLDSFSLGFLHEICWSNTDIK
jgi:hypothetical protein